MRGRMLSGYLGVRVRWRQELFGGLAQLSEAMRDPGRDTGQSDTGLIPVCALTIDREAHSTARGL